MPFPGDLTSRILTGTYRWGNGAPQNGFLTIAPSTDLVDTTGDVIIRAIPLPAVTLYLGSFSVSLLCNDNADISPQPWYWIITENIAGGQTRTRTVQIPTGAGSIDLAQLVDVSPGPAVSTLYGVLGSGNTNRWE